MEDEDQTALLIRASYALRLVVNFAVASSALFVWDYIITFGMEVDLVWKSKWSFMKGLYLLQRYLPFIDIVWLTLYALTKMGLTKIACQKIHPLSAVLTAIEHFPTNSVRDGSSSIAITASPLPTVTDCKTVND